MDSILPRPNSFTKIPILYLAVLLKLSEEVCAFSPGFSISYLKGISLMIILLRVAGIIQKHENADRPIWLGCFAVCSLKMSILNATHRKPNALGTGCFIYKLGVILHIHMLGFGR